MALTDSKIKQAKVEAKDYKLSDGKGLFLLVAKTGAKYWRLKYRFLGKEKLLSFGVYPSVTLKQARKATVIAKEQLEQGIDPSHAKKAKKAERIEAQTNNLQSIAMEWHTQQSKQWSEGYSAKVLRALERDLFPYTGTLPLDDITPPQLLAVFRRVDSRGATESAHRLKQTAGQIFRYAVATGRAQRDITQDLKGALPTPKKNHFPAIIEPAKVGRFTMTHSILRLPQVIQRTGLSRSSIYLRMTNHEFPESVSLWNTYKSLMKMNFLKYQNSSHTNAWL